MKVKETAKITFEVLATLGIDAIVSGVADKYVPKTYGFAGVCQKICTKAASLGVSIIAADALETSLDNMELKAQLVLDAIEDMKDGGSN